ncbi:MAG TPA: ABC transporter permease [Chitinophagaceae bacterium]|nr:ABC transporter permease [Chitinophagaceae bacterium]
MFQNYLKIALRNIWRNRTFSFLNIVGLAIGITCAACIFLWAEDEVGYDSVHAKKDVLYQVYQNQESEGKIFTINATPGPLAQGMKEEIPGVKNTCRTTWSQPVLFSAGDTKLNQEGLYADASIFSMFTLHFMEGNAQQAFSQTNALVVTVSMAHRFFGKGGNYIGKVLQSGNDNFIITGVIKDLPENSTLQFDWLAPFQIHFNNNQWLEHWEYNGVQTFVELDPLADKAGINQKLGGYTLQKTTKRVGRPFLLSMHDWRLRSNFENGQATGGRILYVRMFSIIACIILVIACINFMNLATAQSSNRAKEIGVRKAIGAERGRLIKQFLFETVVMAVVAVIIAVGILQVLMPSFNTLVQKNLRLDLFNPVHIACLLAIGLICGLLAGSYPSFYLSSFNPILALKGVKMKQGSAVFVRKGLVVVQFTASVIFIIGTIVIYQQIQHVKNRPLGYDKHNLLQLGFTDAMKKSYAALKQDLLSTGKVEGVAASMLNVLYMGSTTSDFTWQGKDPNVQVILTQNWISPEYMNTMGMDMKQGRSFYENAKQDSSSVIINEAFAKLIGNNGNVLGQTLTRGKRTFTIVGITSDVIYGDMYSRGSPMIFLCHPEMFNYLYLRLKDERLAQAVSSINSIIKKYDPEYSSDYAFVDAEFNKMFGSEVLTEKFSRIFALLVIIISCFGLFALVAYTAEMKTKEIGIRKVLGASVGGIVSMLSKEFLKLVLIASVIAIPAGWLIMNKWLQDFAYRIDINWMIFAMAAAAAVIIAMITITFQAVRAAMANPVKSLRAE